MDNDQARANDNRHPPIFWLATGALAVLTIVVVVQFVAVGDSRAIAALAGLVITLVIVAAIVGVFAWQISSRMRAARAALPGALLIPVVVGWSTAEASSRLAVLSGDPTFQMKPSTYATVAVDRSGLHFVVDNSPPWASVASSLVGDIGIGTTVVGQRTVVGIVLRIGLPDESIELPLVPMRLRGNPLRLIRTNELYDVVARIQRALAGATESRWPY